uniref:Potassium channel regulator n=1 Tax=Cricetulus griseus TaxID=10029 RepID=A0A8C2QNT3_CRIGR
GGKIFTTRLSTLKQFPTSLLAGLLDGRDQEFKTIFVDRDGALFSFILDFLRNELQREHLLQSRPAVMEVHFLNQNNPAFFRVFSFCSKTIELLTRRITVFVEQPAMTLLPLPPQRPSHHDLVFYCGSDGIIENHTGVSLITKKMTNGTNVFVLLIDTLLKEGFHLVSTRTSASGDKSECYVFEGIPGGNKTPKPETTTIPASSQK